MILKRPKTIWVITVLFVAIPVMLFFLDLSSLALVSAPIYLLIAIGIFSVRKWGWYLSLFAGCAVFIINSFALVSLRWSGMFALFVFNGLLLASGIILFRRELMAPYFFPRLRWWESEERIRTQLLGHLQLNHDVYEGEISDISLSGCFMELNTPVDKAISHRRPVLSIQLRSRKLEIPVLIMRLIRSGYGIGCMFSASALQYKGQIENLIREMLHQDPSHIESKNLTEERFVRAKTGFKGFVIIKGSSYPVKVLDISLHGARISVSEEVEELLELHLFHIEFHRISIEVDAKIRHVQHQGETFIIGLEFVPSLHSSLQLRRLVSSLKHAGYETMIRRGDPKNQKEKRRISPLFPFFGK